MSSNEPASAQVVKGKPRQKLGRISEDLVHGQVVIVAARWILVVTGLLFALWNPGGLGELRIQLLVIFLLAGANFYLHAQLLMRHPVIDQMVYAASIGDLAVITIIIIGGGGFDSGVYIFYFPAILAFSVAFPTNMTAFFVGGTMSVYGLISLVTPVVDEQVLASRLLMLAAVAVCGNLYWRIEDRQRRAAAEARQELMAQIHQRQTASQA